MVKGARALLVGVVGAAVICGAGYVRDWQQGQRLAQAIERCEAENVRERQRTGLDFRLFCNIFEIDELKSQGQTLTGAQKEIADLFDVTRRRGSSNWYFVGAIVLGVLALPYLWYFSLRRIRELRDAVSGKEAA